MTDYAKFTLGFTYSESSDYSDPLHSLTQSVLAPYEFTPDECVVYKIDAEGGTPIVLSGHFTTITFMLIKHMGITDDVVANYDDTDGSARDQRILPGSSAGKGGILVVSDVDPATNLTLTSDDAAQECLVVICGT